VGFMGCFFGGGGTLSDCIYEGGFDSHSWILMILLGDETDDL
jgi:hypothetical protein